MGKGNVFRNLSAKRKAPAQGGPSAAAGSPKRAKKSVARKAKEVLTAAPIVSEGGSAGGDPSMPTSKSKAAATTGSVSHTTTFHCPNWEIEKDDAVAEQASLAKDFFIAAPTPTDVNNHARMFKNDCPTLVANKTMYEHMLAVRRMSLHYDKISKAWIKQGEELADNKLTMLNQNDELKKLQAELEACKKEAEVAVAKAEAAESKVAVLEEQVGKLKADHAEEVEGLMAKHYEEAFEVARHLIIDVHPELSAELPAILDLDKAADKADELEAAKATEAGNLEAAADNAVDPFTPSPSV